MTCGVRRNYSNVVVISFDRWGRVDKHWRDVKHNYRSVTGEHIMHTGAAERSETKAVCKCSRAQKALLVFSSAPLSTFA